jgi:Mg/Co/Ni transporter MgtE
MNNLSSNQIKKLLQMASTKSPEEILNSLSPEQSAKIKKIMNNKEMTEKIIKSKVAQNIINKFQNEK